MEMHHKISQHGFSMSYPDGFHVMEEEETRQLKFLGNGEGICLSDPDRHMMVSIGWKQIWGIVSLLLGTKDLAKDMEKRIRQPMKQYGYRKGESLKKKIGKKEAMGFSYEYSVQGTGMTGESYVVKDGKEIYYLHVYMRTGLKSGSYPVWEGMLESISWE